MIYRWIADASIHFLSSAISGYVAFSLISIIWSHILRMDRWRDPRILVVSLLSGLFALWLMHVVLDFFIRIY